jgi:hypothetical protein
MDAADQQFFATATVLTSTGYVLSIPFDGVFYPSFITWTGAGCSGTPYLNTGDASSAGQTMSGTRLLYSRAADTLLVPANSAPGYATAVAFTAATTENPSCQPNAGAAAGVLLTPITRAAAGLPNTFALPLHME